MSLRCSIGWHKDNWSYINRNSCEQGSTCERCGRHQTRITHTWESWSYNYPSGNCTQTRLCKRCAEEEERVSHSYGSKWRYVSGYSCKYVEICDRCEHENAKFIEKHDWGHWFPHPNERSMLMRVCRRCNKQETQTVQK
jgi:hypothetical protein